VGVNGRSRPVDKVVGLAGLLPFGLAVPMVWSVSGREALWLLLGEAFLGDLDFVMMQATWKRRKRKKRERGGGDD